MPNLRAKDLQATTPQTSALRHWRWGKLPTYNGFTHDERVRGWQAVSWLMDQGLFQRPTRCCISGSEGEVSYHSECYYSLEPYPLARPVHLALHRRFRQPTAWNRIVERHAVTGLEWFAQLSFHACDLAGKLRAREGCAIMDLAAKLNAEWGADLRLRDMYPGRHQRG